MRPIIIEQKYTPAYEIVAAIDEASDKNPWYYDIWNFLEKEIYSLGENAKDKRGIWRLAVQSQTNKGVEAANKNIKTILQKMVETYKDWSEKLLFAFWGYRMSIRTSIGVTPYSLIYGMETVLPIEVEIPSLRVMAECQIAEADWQQSRF
ncbi:uncharacterized protein LOC114285532 [Camellia sinensis]|uniref:uncharacterized protein LOC114285532 n=1 Tax=Camellia sinensis TaxID=4442 RepID=UPI001035FD67|nr:uncharacterized protein LOC114285532 [Camellia sinensis]